MEPEPYFTKKWIALLGVAMGCLALGLGAWLLRADAPGMLLVKVAGVVGLVTGLALFAVAWRSRTTPIVEVWPDRLEIKVALLQPRRTVPWAELKAWDEAKNGQVKLQTATGTISIPLGALSPADAAKLRQALTAHAGATLP